MVEVESGTGEKKESGSDIWALIGGRTSGVFDEYLNATVILN